MWKKKADNKPKADSNNPNPPNIKISEPKMSVMQVASKATASMANVRLIGRWTHRTRTSGRSTMLLDKPNIAFMPKDGSISNEILQLEEKLEQEHHRESFDFAMKRASIKQSTFGLERDSLAPAPSLLKLMQASHNNNFWYKSVDFNLNVVDQTASTKSSNQEEDDSRRCEFTSRVPSKTF